jgi:hypothetical protein
MAAAVTRVHPQDVDAVALTTARLPRGDEKQGRDAPPDDGSPAFALSGSRDVDPDLLHRAEGTHVGDVTGIKPRGVVEVAVGA